MGKDEQRRLVLTVLDRYNLESEQPLFKMAMIANAAWAMEVPLMGHSPGVPTINPLTKLRRQLDANSALSTSFPNILNLPILP
jgi:hypothetical protein